MEYQAKQETDERRAGSTGLHNIHSWLHLPTCLCLYAMWAMVLKNPDSNQLYSHLAVVELTKHICQVELYFERACTYSRRFCVMSKDMMALFYGIP